MTDCTSILVIDDVPKIIEGIKGGILPKNHSLIPFLVESKDKHHVVQQIISEIKINKVTHIITDRGFSTISMDDENNVTKNLSAVFKIDDIILDIIENLDNEALKRIKSFIIYTYDPFTSSIGRQLRELRKTIEACVAQKIKANAEQLKRIKASIITIETSSIYRRPGKSGIYPDGFYDDCVIGSHDACRFYGNFLSDVLSDIINSGVQFQADKINPYSYSKVQNYEMLKHIRSFEDLIPFKNRKYYMGTVSCYGDIYGTREYLVDVPFKKYFQDINNYIEKKELNCIFYNDLNISNSFSEYQFIYYKYDVYPDDQLFLTEMILSNKLKNAGLKCETICKSWLPLLHSAIYYCDDSAWDKPLLDKRLYEKPLASVSIFFPIISINEPDFHGTYNFTLFTENNNADLDVMELMAAEKYASLIETKLFELIIPYKTKEVKKQASKAAETKILSRNFSHHIGSHVMPNVSLRQIRERFKQLCDKEISEDYLDFLKTKLDTYITERNEFLCDPDGSLKPVLFYSQIISPFFENILLIDNLCRSEGLGFRKDKGCDIEIEVKINNLPVTASYNECPILLYNGLSGKNSHGAFQFVAASVNGNDLPIAIANVHTIYSILENFIRNTAKHQKEKFEIDYQTQSLKVPLKIFLYLEQDKTDIHSFWLTISDNVSIVPKGFENNDPVIIDNNNAVSQSNLGIIDFKICAGLLNKRPFDQVDESIFKINRAVDGKLSYSFKILKPKDVCLIGYRKNDNLKHQTLDYFANAEDFINAKRSPIPYQFFLIKEAEFKELVKNTENLRLLQFRVLIEKDATYEGNSPEYFEVDKYGRKYLLSQAINLNKNTNEILEQCWQQWLKRWGGDKKELIVYSDDKLDNWDSPFNGGDALDFKYGHFRPFTKSIEILSSYYPKVFYDHHGGGFCNAVFPAERSFLSSNAYIAFGKNSKDFAIIKNTKPVAGEKWLLPYWLTEAGLSKILIIDERVVDLAANIYNHKLSRDALLTKGKFWYSKYTNQFHSNNVNWWSKEESKQLHNIDSYWASNIYVATHLNGKPIKDSLFFENNEHWVKVIVNDNLSIRSNFDYLTCAACKVTDFNNEMIINEFEVIIIHRTFLNDQSLKTYWGGKTSTEVLYILNKFFPLVLITSGGGDVINYAGNFKFISFNEILNCISVPECIGKQSLINILFTK